MARLDLGGRGSGLSRGTSVQPRVPMTLPPKPSLSPQRTSLGALPGRPSAGPGNCIAHVCCSLLFPEYILCHARSVVNWLFPSSPWGYSMTCPWPERGWPRRVPGWGGDGQDLLLAGEGVAFSVEPCGEDGDAQKPASPWRAVLGPERPRAGRPRAGRWRPGAWRLLPVLLGSRN